MTEALTTAAAIDIAVEPTTPPGLSPLCISYSTEWVKSKLLVLIEHVNNVNKTEKIGGT